MLPRISGRQRELRRPQPVSGRQPRYARLFELSQHDYKGWAHGLKACGYATNPQYANKLIQIIELYKLNDYDKAKRYDRFMATHSGTDQPINAEGTLHPIHIFNDNYYLYAREGETFKSIGKEVGISWRKLASTTSATSTTCCTRATSSI